MIKKKIKRKKKMKNLKIYLFRHGQSYYNKNKIFTGGKDSRLTLLGKKTSRNNCKKIKDKQIDVAFQNFFITFEGYIKRSS